MQLNIIIFQYINGFANECILLNSLGIFFAEYAQYLLGLILIVLIFYPKKDRNKNREMISVGVLAALFARLIIKPAILFFISMPRPFMILPEVNKLINTSSFENFQSFPSGHAIFFFALSTIICFYNKKLGIFFFIISVLMIFSRIFTGVHWPVDVLTGAILGILTGVIFFKCYQEIKFKK